MSRLDYRIIELVQQRLLSRQGKEVTWREGGTSLNYGAKGGSETLIFTLLRPLSCVVFKFSGFLFILFLFIILSAKRVSLVQSLGL